MQDFLTAGTIVRAAAPIDGRTQPNFAATATLDAQLNVAGRRAAGTVAATHERVDIRGEGRKCGLAFGVLSRRSSA